MSNVFQPFKKRILIKPSEVATETNVGGITLVLPQNENTKPEEGIVISVGPDVSLVQVNDHVIFGRYSGMEYSIDQIKYYVLHEDDVMGKFVSGKVPVEVI